MTGGQLRSYIERRGIKATPFQEQVAGAYAAANDAKPKSALRNVKRWFSRANVDREIRPGAEWRAAVREVLGDDPFEAPSPWELRDRLESVAALLAEMQESRADLLERYEHRLRLLELAQSPAPAVPIHREADR